MLDARLNPVRARPWYRLGAFAVALVALGVFLLSAFLFAASGRALASQPAASSDGKANSAASCASLKKKAKRYKRGSAKRGRYVRRYKKCRARARKPGGRTPTGAAPQPPTSTLPAGAIYLPSIFPNPNGYRAGAGCLPGYNQTYIQAGFSCQYAGYNSNLGYPGSPVWAPVYLLFGVWRCADHQFRFRC